MTLFHYNTLFSFTLNIKNVTSQRLYSYIQQGQPLCPLKLFFIYLFFFKQASNFLLKNAARHSAVTLSRFFFFFLMP